MNPSTMEGVFTIRICVLRAKTLHQNLRRTVLTNYETFCKELCLR